MATFENEAAQVYQKAAAEVRFVSVGFLEKLEAAEVFTAGAPIVTEIGYGDHDAKAPTVLGTTDLSFQVAAINADAVEIDGVLHPPSTAVQFRVAGGTAGRLYWVRVQKGTTTAQTLILDVRLAVV